jgi:hypothetical protein
MLTHSLSTGPNPTLEIDLQQVAALTARMLAASEAEDWALVCNLDAQRYALLQTLPPELFQADRATARAILRDALESTERITERVRCAQHAGTQAVAAARHGQQAALRYLEHSRRR